MFRKFFLITIFFAVIFLQAVFADSYEDREGRGLVILTEPSNAKVYINGIEWGRTPLTLPELMPGSYVIQLEKESYEDRQIVVRVPRHSKIVVSLDLEKAMGTLIVQPKKAADVPAWLPFKPEIYVDGEYQSGSAISLPIGFQHVLVRAFGFDDASETVLITQDRTKVLELLMQPASFHMSNVRIRRNRFNPANSGSLGISELVFEVNAPGNGTLKVTNNIGDEVFSATLNSFTSWSQSAIWNGRNNYGEIVPDGIYTIKVDAESIPWNENPPIQQSATLSVEIDSSIEIFPESFASGKSGLLFAAGTNILPKGSYQLDALMFFGKPLTSENAWSNLPLAFSFRYAPLDFLEAAVSLNVTPEFGNETIIGAGASAKWQIFNKNKLAVPLGFAAILSYGWAQEGPVTPFAMGTGVGLALPVSWTFGDDCSALSASLSPGILWAGESGFPESGTPSGILSAGIAYRRSIFNSGISLRTEYFFENGISLGPVTLGGEIKFFPQPSVFVISAMAGIVYDKNSFGGFGGIGIGFIQ
jgi:hypothetical protein